MAGMPNPIETAADIGGAGQYFGQVETWLNDPDPVRRRNNRTGARGRVANNFAGVTAPTLASNPGIHHFNKHWRHMGGAAAGPGWWPNVTRARVNSQMSAAFASALAPANDQRDIHIMWDCREPDMNAGNPSFQATAYVLGNAVWIYARTPRAPGNVADPATGLTNFGFHANSNLSAESAGPFAPLGDSEVANYDGTAGFDSSFDHALEAVTETNGFRESWSFFPIDHPVVNGSQTLVGLSYTRDSWRRVGADEEDTFAEEPLHSETGYLLWDGEQGHAYRVAAMPRGVALLAVAREVRVDAAELRFEADTTSNDPLAGGILSNPFLAESARTVRFTSTMQIARDSSSFSYEDVAEQVREGRDEPVRHIDRNSLIRV